MRKLILFALILPLFFGSCSDDEGTITPPPPPPPPLPELTDNILVYDTNLMHEDHAVLVVENGSTLSYLVNKEGERLFTWEFTSKLGNDLNLLPDGRVLGIFKSESPTIMFGGWGGIARIIEPDGTIVWEYEVNTSHLIAHHDVEMLPNGNVLIMVWEKIDEAEAQEAGAKVTTEVVVEKLIEVNPETDEVVWEWRSWDHIIQDKDDTFPNFGSVSDNPQLLDINFLNAINGDIMHANGIDYDEDRDVIFLSVNFWNEIWVIDHSTTTAEATGSTGGNYGKGGNLVYRFGNPETYKNPNGLKRFDRNHFPNLLEGDEPGAGNVLVYVNGNSILQSTIYELDIPENFELLPNQDNEPTVVWSFTDPELFAGRTSGATRLSNGNTLICESDFGYWEVTPDGEVAWQYTEEIEPFFWRGYSFDKGHPALEALGIAL